LIPIEPFLVEKQLPKSSAPPTPNVKLMRFDAGFEKALMDGSCKGNGFILIRVSFDRGAQVDMSNIGYAIRAVSGVNDKGFFPGYLKPFKVVGNTAELRWIWFRRTANPDGQLKWNLQVVAVSKNGVESQPAELCVSTNKSCEPK
jgi:hypothetical protein